MTHTNFDVTCHVQCLGGVQCWLLLFLMGIFTFDQTVQCVTNCHALLVLHL